jgi:hypothetical protein
LANSKQSVNFLSVLISFNFKEEYFISVLIAHLKQGSVSSYNPILDFKLKAEVSSILPNVPYISEFG